MAASTCNPTTLPSPSRRKQSNRRCGSQHQFCGLAPGLDEYLVRRVRHFHRFAVDELSRPFLSGKVGQKCGNENLACNFCGKAKNQNIICGFGCCLLETGYFKYEAVRENFTQKA